VPEPEDLTPAPPDRHAQAEESFLRWLAEVVVLLAVAVVLALGIKTFVVQPFVIPSSSMVPTLQIGDRVLVNKFIYRFTQPKPGDVVVFTSPDNDNMDLIKRVIAVGGQSVQIRDGIVYVNGQARTEPFVNPEVRDTYTSAAPVKVPDGYVWVMGDNRTNSRDSRYFGPQPVKNLLGRAFAIYWPLTRIRAL
jgi:signal peptidase I